MDQVIEQVPAQGCAQGVWAPMAPRGVDLVTMTVVREAFGANDVPLELVRRIASSVAA